MNMDMARMCIQKTVSAPSSASGNANIFKRYSVIDLFDEQYGHLQRNDLIEG